MGWSSVGVELALISIQSPLSSDSSVPVFPEIVFGQTKKTSDFTKAVWAVTY